MPSKPSVRELMQLIDNSDEKYFVAELETGYVSLSSKRQYFKGYSFFSSKMAVNELHYMPPDFRTKHLLEMTIVTEAVQNVVQAKKMNVAYLGNSLPHVHWNIIPRFGNDPMPHDAIWSIDRGLIESVTLSDDELLAIKSTLRAELERMVGRYGIGISFECAA